MQQRERVFKVCVCVFIKGGEEEGVGEGAGCVMLLLWQIDVKSSGASQPLHWVNNDVRTANEGLHVDTCPFMCLPVGPNASVKSMSMHTVCPNLHKYQ